ncbi:MAG: molybdenum cofactor biosynthesis protein MoaE [Spirochaetia bacterium]|nr:molybdenum cofactor biosynthesis protein MoaE [Spirochaetia bacterium]
MVHITEKKIIIDELVQKAHHPEAGALVIFSGEARNLHDGKSVTMLEYEAQVEMAEKSIEDILELARNRWPLKIAMAVHRIGKVEISEPAVVVVTAAAHRKEAYEANQFIIDQIKEHAPIWKKESFADGNSKWQ